jgi:hypothetical protein
LASELQNFFTEASRFPRDYSERKAANSVQAKDAGLRDDSNTRPVARRTKRMSMAYFKGSKKDL